jgi:N-acetylneuraminate synthase/sialic acid synthase
MKKFLVNPNDIFVIAEVGQNHQGSIDNALKYVKIFSELGANAVKFQMRNNKKLFSEDAYNAEYNSENAFDKTYGKHREKLELSFNDFKKIKEECRKRKIKFIATPFDENSLNKLCKLGVDIIKIASFDLGNLSLIEKISKKKKPVIISVGGGNNFEIKASIKILAKNKIPLGILHCNSEYPTHYSRLGLGNIKSLKKIFPNATIGSSDHFNGILSGPVAYLMGARIFEKHVTLDRSWKGTDHSFALEPEGFRKFTRDIKRTPEMLPLKDKKLIGKEIVFKKLGKSLTPNKKIKKNQIIKINNLTGVIFDKNYIPIRETYKIIGKKAKNDLEPGKPIKRYEIKN